MEFVVVIVGALLIAGAVKYAADRMLSGEDRKTAARQDAIIQGAEKTAGLVQQAESSDFVRRLGEINIKVEELGAYGAKLVGLENEKSPAEDTPGEHIVLNLRWKNTGKKVIRCVTFATAFLSPDGKIICPDALDPDPWIQQFGCVAAAKFTGHFGQGQGRMQKDMRNPFLLYHAPVEKAVVLGVRVEYDDGEMKEKTVLQG